MKTLKQIQATQQGRTNRKHGQETEAITRNILGGLGFKCLTTIETGWRVKRVAGRIRGATPMAKVAWDIRAIIGNGRSVLVEVKWRKDNKLSFVDLETHQHRYLQEHKDNGGLSLVSFCCPKGVAIFEYGSPDLPVWEKGTKLAFEDAQVVCERFKQGLKWEATESNRLAN